MPAEDDVELGSVRRVTSFHFHDDHRSCLDSSRQSLEDDQFYPSQDCDIHIHDDVSTRTLADPEEADRVLDTCSWHRTSGSSDELKARLQARDSTRTRWINVVGWSHALINDITAFHLGYHNCLSLETTSKQMMGGPVKAKNDGQFIWLQTQVWFVGKRAPLWSSMRQTRFRMIVCLPTSTQAGTLITNFRGPFRLAEELSTILTDGVLEDHPMGRQALGCPWILAFAMLRTMAEQLDFAFELFDPVGVSSQLPVIPRLEELPQILEKSDRLARLNRYLSSLDEFISFFISVKQLLPLEPIPEKTTDIPAFRCIRVGQFAQLEVSRAQHKIQHQQRLCETYSRQFESLVQLVISYSTTQITERLDQGRRIADQFAKIGMFLAGLAGVVAPMSLLTGFYGMNVKEFTDDATATLFDFWQIGIPVVLAAGLCFAFLTLWALTQPKQTQQGSYKGDRNGSAVG